MVDFTRVLYNPTSEVGFSKTMKVSSRTHYGLRAMTELGKAFGGRTLSLTEIAATERIPLPYLEQIVSPLRRAGLVEGTRGLHGGYRLTRDPSLIRVGEIVRVLEGADATAPVDCLADGYVEGSCVRDPGCLSRPLWARVKAAMDAVLDATTLADLCQDPGAGRDLLTLSPGLSTLTKGLAVSNDG
ncbi:MAG TPA: Rrf2 family transcriptional regulator [Actinomycetes bacterium]|nr:Rrf2 family transcriptional regulator [Actinomycetes bacterium]